jgi:hypothetical protein
MLNCHARNNRRRGKNRQFAKKKPLAKMNQPGALEKNIED